MQPAIPLVQNGLCPLEIQDVEGASVNLRSLRFGEESATWGARPLPFAESVVVEFYAWLDVIQPMAMLGAWTNLTVPALPRLLLGHSEPTAHLEKSLAWMSFAQEALRDSRPMTDWERKVAADFFWSEFD